MRTSQARAARAASAARVEDVAATRVPAAAPRPETGRRTPPPQRTVITLTSDKGRPGGQVAVLGKPLGRNIWRKKPAGSASADLQRPLLRRAQALSLPSLPPRSLRGAGRAQGRRYQAAARPGHCQALERASRPETHGTRSGLSKQQVDDGQDGEPLQTRFQ